MKPDYNLCDICGAKSGETFVVATDRRMDAAGSMDDVFENIDLCPKHLREALFWMLLRKESKRLPDYERGQEFMAWFDANKRKS